MPHINAEACRQGFCLAEAADRRDVGLLVQGEKDGMKRRFTVEDNARLYAFVIDGN
jgi:hypothetical protein